MSDNPHVRIIDSAPTATDRCRDCKFYWRAHPAYHDGEMSDNPALRLEDINNSRGGEGEVREVCKNCACYCKRRKLVLFQTGFCGWWNRSVMPEGYCMLWCDHGKQSTE